MPPVEVHVKDTLARTGKGYQELHDWIDKDETKKLERHDIKRVLENAEHIKSVWGQEAANEFVIHLHDDIKASITRVQEEYAKRMAETLAYFGIK